MSVLQLLRNVRFGRIFWQASSDESTDRRSENFSGTSAQKLLILRFQVEKVDLFHLKLKFSFLLHNYLC
jgi:hypothetical protein